MKRALTSIAAASLALGMMVPAAFATTTTAAPTLKAAGAQTITIDSYSNDPEFELYREVSLATPLLDNSGIKEYQDLQSCLDANFPTRALLRRDKSLSGRPEHRHC